MLEIKDWEVTCTIAEALSSSTNHTFYVGTTDEQDAKALVQQFILNNIKIKVKQQEVLNND